MSSAANSEGRAASLWSDVAGVLDCQCLSSIDGDLVRAYDSPTGAPDGAELGRSAVYGTACDGGRDLHLFVFRRADTAERRPMLLFAHGGARAAMEPNMHLRHARHSQRAVT